MCVVVKEFVDDFCVLVKRVVMVRVVRVLLFSVIRLLCVVDMVDVYRLLVLLKLVCCNFLINYKLGRKMII